MVKVLLSRGMCALVDERDYERVASKSWRVQQNQDGRYYAAESGNPWLSMHRFIMRCPADKIVLHLNENGLDNRRSNLKVGSNSENQHLRFRDAKGYHWETARGKWKAMISIDYKPVYLGRFDREEDAAMAYSNAKAAVLDKIFGNGDEDDE